MSPLSINIVFASAKWKRSFPRLRAKVERAADAAFSAARTPPVFRKNNFEATIVLASNTDIRKLNRNWRGKDKPTNVLAFPQIDLPSPSRRRAASAKIDLPPAPPGGRTNLGDVILAIETIRRECREQRKNLENHAIHLVVHGVLHLLGYDHLRPHEATAMEKLESDILASLGYPDPYATACNSKTRRDE